jgi:WD40 repeat protein
VFTVASLGSKCGEVFVKQYDAVTERLLQAHSSSIVCLAIDNEGVCIATASDKGTLIRVWDTTSGALLHELRRGIDVANILCLAFNSNATNLICSSDKVSGILNSDY